MTHLAATPPSNADIAALIDALDWQRLRGELDAEGVAATGPILTRDQCTQLHSFYEKAEFRSRIIMSRHGFGRGEYKYFAYPLPALVEALRTALWPHLASIADRWNAATGSAVTYPSDHAGFLARCHAAGQPKPTPLMLKYSAGDYNCLHQDVYGELVFPLQAVFLLSEPQREFTGGEFVMTEQRPRMHSRAQVVSLELGGCAIFAVHQRPVQGARGIYRVNMRHGVSRIREGERYTLGVIFHDAG
jgi:hypothetical protein